MNIKYVIVYEENLHIYDNMHVKSSRPIKVLAIYGYSQLKPWPIETTGS